MSTWLSTFALFHDYGWFIAILAWSAAAIMWRQTVRDDPGWAWLPWAAVTGAAAAAIELFSFVRTVPVLPLIQDYFVEDMVLGILSALMVAGWIRGLPAAAAWRTAGVMAVFATAGFRANWPDQGATGLAVAASVVALLHLFTTRQTRGSRLAMVLAVVALWFTSAGPLADSQPRRLVNFGELSALWSVIQATAAVAALAGVVAPWFAQGESRREWRPLLVASIVWLALGLGLAATMSRWARRSFEVQSLGRAKAAAALMDTAAIAKLFGPEFTLTGITPRNTPIGVPEVGPRTRRSCCRPPDRRFAVSSR